MRRSNPGHLHFTTDQFLESYWPIFAWAFLYLLIAGAIQFNIPYPWDYDTAYRRHGEAYTESRDSPFFSLDTIQLAL